MKKKLGDDHFIYTPNDLPPTQLSLLQRLGVLAVQADELYNCSERKFFIRSSDGDRVPSGLDGGGSIDYVVALENALIELSECSVCEEGK